MYAFCAPVALRGRILRIAQRREVVIVGIRFLVELIATSFYYYGACAPYAYRACAG